jgi:hypothetical protein
MNNWQPIKRQASKFYKPLRLFIHLFKNRIMKNLLLSRQRKWKPFSLVFVLQLLVIFATAQVRVSGKVTGPQGNGVAAITVQVRNTTLATATDNTGVYVLNGDLKPGNYVIEFSGVGFKGLTQNFTVSGGNVEVNASLQDDVLGLDEVVVTGTGVSTKKRQLGNSVATVSGRDLVRGGATSVDMVVLPIHCIS